MKEKGAMGRRDFFRSVLHSHDGNGETSVTPRPDDFDAYSPRPDYLSMLPPEFSGAMLKAEAMRLGCDPATTSPDDMAAAVVQAMYGAAPETARRQEEPDPAQKKTRESAE